MNKILFNVCLILVLFFSTRTKASELSTNWGENICGARLSITLTNEIVKRGTAITFIARIENTSTNDIEFLEESPRSDFSVFLIAQSGVSYKVSPERKRVTEHHFIKRIEGKKTSVWLVPLTIGENIELGDYGFQVTRRFIGSEGTQCELVSNITRLNLLK